MNVCVYVVVLNKKGGVVKVFRSSISLGYEKLGGEVVEMVFYKVKWKFVEF